MGTENAPASAPCFAELVLLRSVTVELPQLLPDVLYDYVCALQSSSFNILEESWPMIIRVDYSRLLLITSQSSL